MRGDRSACVALAVAFALHAVAFLAVRLVPPRVGVLTARGAMTSTLDVDVDVDVTAKVTVGGEERNAMLVDRGARSQRLARAVGLPSGVAAGASEAPAGAPLPDGVVTAPNGEGWSLRTTTVDLGIDPRRRRLFADAPGWDGTPSGAPPPAGASRTGGVIEALDAHDVALGLGRGGLVNSAVHDAVQASSVMGKAIFAITIDGAGKVTVGVSSASRDEIGWAGLSESIRASVAARKGQMNLPPGGLRIAVEADAKEQFPNGVKPKDLGTRGVAKGPSVTETKERIDLHLPELAVVHTGKVCSVGVSPIPPFISGGCDPSNIGAIAQRIVTAHVVSETRL